MIETTNHNSWTLDFLVNYIEHRHHKYVEEKMSVIKQCLHKVNKLYGREHPELQQINEQFIASAHELTIHMQKEKLELFPYVRKMVRSKKDGENFNAPYYSSIKEPIRNIKFEHEIEEERFRIIKTLSNNYTPPKETCDIYKEAFALLKAFEDNLCLHIHMENNIIFPKAEKLEKELQS